MVLLRSDHDADDAKEFVNRTVMHFAHDLSSVTTNTAQPSGVVQLITPM